MDIDNGWESTCKILLGSEAGPIAKCEKYLLRYVEPYHMEKSIISGKDVVVSGEYEKGARFISGNEIMQYDAIAKGAKLSINDIKDIDSLVRAAGEMAIYSGNDVLGKSSNITLSNKVLDSNTVYKSHEVIFSKNIACCHIVKYSEHCYGGVSVGKHAQFTIHSFEIYESSRLFECVRVYHSADCAYGVNLDNCHDCLFSFNLRTKSKCIGNLQIEPAKYASLKSKLLSEIAGELGKNGSVPTVVEIVGGAK